jgi:hypothetical protein
VVLALRGEGMQERRSCQIHTEFSGASNYWKHRELIKGFLLSSAEVLIYSGTIRKSLMTFKEI